MQTLQHMHEADVSRGSLSTTISVHDPLTDRSPLIEDRDLDKTESYDIKTDKLFVTKSICVISQVQFVSAPRSYLRQLADAVSNPITGQLPLEAYIFNLLYDVPMPPAGRSMKFYGVSRPVFCQRPSKYCCMFNTMHYRIHVIRKY